MSEKQIVLIIDDKQANRVALTDFIAMLGHSVLEAENGLLGLAEARRSQPDLILLDINMPEMNGMQFLRERKEDSTLKSIPVIIITAYGSSDKEFDFVECLNLGAEDYLMKPPQYPELKARVGNALERRRRQMRESELRQRLEDMLLDVKDAERWADRLLHSIFPSDAVQELKKHDNIAPRRHDDVGVLFCDVVGFTPYCESHDPAEVIEKLETLVEAQEEIAEQHGVEKVKTIGDAFMATAGLQSPGDEALLECVRCGLKFASLPEKLGLDWQVRVGIHAGPVIAGKVGKKKFAYDVWGDTVNTAARVQTEAMPTTLYVSADVWQRIAPCSHGVSQGMTQLKGLKQEIELYRVTQVSDDDRSAAKQ